MLTSRLKSFLVPCLAATLTGFGAIGPANADTIAFVGTGNVPDALGPKFAEMGHTIVYGSREPDRDDVQALVAKTGNGATAVTPAESVVDADIVFIAVPGLIALDVVEGLGDLSGKIVVDPTNPLQPDPEDGFANHMVETSNAEMMQDMLPDSYVIKAFNTLGVRTMNDPASAGGPVTIPLVGNDDAAKARIAELIEGIGFESADFGPIRFAHVLEGMLALWANGIRLGEPFDWYVQKH